MSERDRENALLRRVDRQIARTAREDFERGEWAREFAAGWNDRFFKLLDEERKAARPPQLPRARGRVRR